MSAAPRWLRVRAPATIKCANGLAEAVVDGVQGEHMVHLQTTLEVAAGELFEMKLELAGQGRSIDAALLAQRVDPTSNPRVHAVTARFVQVRERDAVALQAWTELQRTQTFAAARPVRVASAPPARDASASPAGRPVAVPTRPASPSPMSLLSWLGWRTD